MEDDLKKSRSKTSYWLFAIVVTVLCYRSFANKESIVNTPATPSFKEGTQYTDNQTTSVTVTVYTRKVSNIRSGPGLNYPILATAQINTPLITNAIMKNDWLKISHSDLPQGGWVAFDLVSFLPLFRQHSDDTYTRSYRESYIGSYSGSGHDAGYNWAEENDIEDEGDCDGKSESFNEGCRSYVEEKLEERERGQKENDDDE